MAKLLSMEPVAYVLKFEREAAESERTTWHIRPLTWKERAQVQDDMVVTEIPMLGPKNNISKGVMRHLSGTQAKRAIEQGLVEIKNLRGLDGKIVVYNQDVAAAHRETVLNMIPPEWTKEIAEEILKRSGLLKEEEKN